MSYATLLLALTALLVLGPQLYASSYASPARFVLSLAVIAAAALAASDTPRLRRTALGLLAFPLAGEILMRTVGTPALRIGASVTLSAYLGFLLVVMLRHVFDPERRTQDAVLGGICVYLLLGTVFYFFFCIVESASPGSFLAGGAALVDAGGAARPEGRYPDLLYFSLVTLTTLGYGDVVPTTPLARSLATAAAVRGQLYLAILMAGLVGQHLAQSGKR